LLVLAAGLSVVFFAGMSWWLVLATACRLGVGRSCLLVVFEPTLCAEGFSWPLLHDYQQQRICTLLDPSA
jgi:rod shape determining protein RodA